MGFIEKILDKFRLEDDYEEDDFLDEEDDAAEFEDEKPKGRFFDRFKHEEEEEVSDSSKEPESTITGKSRTASSAASSNPFRVSSFDEEEESWERKTRKQEKPKRKSRTSSSRRRADEGMRLNIVNPKTFEDTQEIADALLDGSAVCIILEGLDYMLAQRIVDFSCGACYSLDGHVQQPSRNILILAPEHVDISGDVESLLDGNFAIPNMIKSY